MLELEEAGGGDGRSGGSGVSAEKAANGERGISVGKELREGNVDLVSVEEIRTSKGSRRTTSLLNLFIPLSQGMSLASGAMCWVKYS